MQTKLKVHAMPGHLIRRIHQISGHIFTKRTKLVGVDLTSVQFAALNAVRENPGIDQTGVAALIAYDRPTIGGVLDRLDAKGLIRRHVSDTDRRARQIYMTEEGMKFYHEILPVVEDLQDEILIGLDEEEQATFLRLARKIVDANVKKQNATPGGSTATPTIEKVSSRKRA